MNNGVDACSILVIYKKKQTVVRETQNHEERRCPRYIARGAWRYPEGNRVFSLCNMPICHACSRVQVREINEAEARGVPSNSDSLDPYA